MLEALKIETSEKVFSVKEGIEEKGIGFNRMNNKFCLSSSSKGHQTTDCVIVAAKNGALHIFTNVTSTRYFYQESCFVENSVEKVIYI